MAIKGRVFFLKNESRRFQGNFFAQLLAVKLETKSNKEERRGKGVCWILFFIRGKF